VLFHVTRRIARGRKRVVPLVVENEGTGWNPTGQEIILHCVGFIEPRAINAAAEKQDRAVAGLKAAERDIKTPRQGCFRGAVALEAVAENHGKIAPVIADPQPLDADIDRRTDPEHSQHKGGFEQSRQKAAHERTRPSERGRAGTIIREGAKGCRMRRQ